MDYTSMSPVGLKPTSNRTFAVFFFSALEVCSISYLGLSTSKGFKNFCQNRTKEKTELRPIVFVKPTIYITLNIVFHKFPYNSVSIKKSQQKSSLLLGKKKIW